MFLFSLGLLIRCGLNMSSLVRSMLSFSLHWSMIILSVLRRDVGSLLGTGQFWKHRELFNIIQNFFLSPIFVSEVLHCFLFCLFLNGASQLLKITLRCIFNKGCDHQYRYKLLHEIRIAHWWIDNIWQTICLTLILIQGWLIMRSNICILCCRWARGVGRWIVGRCLNGTAFHIG